MFGRRVLIAVLFTSVFACAMSQAASAGLFTTYYRNELPLYHLTRAGVINGTEHTAPAGWYYEVVTSEGDTWEIRFDHRSDARRYIEPKDEPEDVFKDHIFKVK